MDLGLTDRELTLIREAIGLFPEVDRVKIYGSRAKGTYNRRSDIDLACFGGLDRRTLARLAAALNELPLPYLIDVLDYDSIRELPLAEEIRTWGIDLYVRAES